MHCEMDDAGADAVRINNEREKKKKTKLQYLTLDRCDSIVNIMYHCSPRPSATCANKV